MRQQTSPTQTLLDERTRLMGTQALQNKIADLILLSNS